MPAVTFYFVLNNSSSGPRSYEMREAAHNGRAARLIKFDKTKPVAISNESPAFPPAVEAVRGGFLSLTDVHGREFNGQVQTMELMLKQANSPAPPRAAPVAANPVRQAPAPKPVKGAAPPMVHINHGERAELGVG